jgi:fructokinase
VDVSLLEREVYAPTPIVVHRVRRTSSGEVRHGYALVCPQCEHRYPSYRPILASSVSMLAPAISCANLFFFDRVSRGVLELAKSARAAGAFVVFEPSASMDTQQFVEAVGLCDVLKYARDRRPKFTEGLQSIARHRPWLQIETRGADGLAYRLREDKGWTTRRAPFVANLRDASGAGDWLTAGVVHSLAAAGVLAPKLAKRRHVEDALTTGEALAAFNCQFEGPRGAMYATNERTEPTTALVGIDTATRKRLCAGDRRPALQMTLTGVCAVCIGLAQDSRSAGGAL